MFVALNKGITFIILKERCRDGECFLSCFTPRYCLYQIDGLKEYHRTSALEEIFYFESACPLQMCVDDVYIYYICSQTKSLCLIGVKSKLPVVTNIIFPSNLIDVTTDRKHCTNFFLLDDTGAIWVYDIVTLEYVMTLQTHGLNLSRIVYCNGSICTADAPQSVYGLSRFTRATIIKIDLPVSDSFNDEEEKIEV